MSAIWLAVTALALLAAVYVVVRARWPRPSRTEVSPTMRETLALQRRELEAEASAQGLDDAEVQALEEELALDALDQLPTEGSDAPASEELSSRDAPPLVPSIIAAAAAVALAVALYALWGEPHARTLADAARLMDAARAGDEAASDRLRAALEARTSRLPSDRDGWFLLGHVRMSAGDFTGAASAFATLHGIAGVNPQVDLAWAQANYLADGGSISAATRTIVDRLLADDPNRPELLEMLAMDALRQGDFVAGARHLARALGQPMPDSRRRILAEMLALARTRLDPERPLVEVTIDAAWEATEQAPWLMVFARPPKGGMPVAALRLPAQHTQTVVLDDATTMTDGASLDGAGPLRVVARLSQTGEATAADVEAAVEELVDPAAQPHIRLRLDGANGQPNSAATAIE